MLQQLGRLLVILGAVVAVVGGLFWLGGKLGLGSLPGDIRFTSDRWGCFLPVVSSLVISIVATILLNLLLRWLSK